SRDAAYVIYTSGSTGQPKGVVVPHRAIGRLVLNNGYAQFGAGDRVGFAANPAFDAATMEIWAPLLNGGRLVVIEQAALLVPEQFGQTLKRQAVGVLWLTVGLFNQYADALAEVFSHLRYLIVGGDALDTGVIARTLRRSPPQHLLNGYGPTETTTFASTHEIRDVPEGARSIPIGRPISNTRIFLLDARLEPVPVSVTGEIYIGGEGVAIGYLKRPRLTSERFVADPFSRKPGERLYRTGDVGRWRADGTIEFLGRNDFQVKIRGFRIELGEIEAQLSEHPGVREAVVLAQDSGAGDKRLVAYYTISPECDQKSIKSDALRIHLQSHLPGYMVPSAYVRLESLPLTPNGKLDRKALPEPEAGAYARRGYEAPVGEVEQTLARLWAELLKLERVGRQDSFFEVGGHSLLAVRLIERMRREGLEADVRALFTSPTLAGLAASAGSKRGLIEAPPNLIPVGCQSITPEMLPLVQLTPEEIDRAVSGVPDRTANVQDIYPLTPLQEGILFQHLLGAKGDAYLLSVLLGFDSRERLASYLGALQAVIDRHDILRTACAWEGLSEPLQVVWRRAPLLKEEVSIDPAAGDAAGQLLERFNPRHY